MKVLRTLTRVFLGPREMDRTIAFYESIFGVRARMRFHYPATQLELAEVGGVLLIAGDERSLAPYTATRATFIVDSLSDFRAALVAQGATILDEPAAAPTGARMRVRHADGIVVEYVQHHEQTATCHEARRAPHAPPSRHFHTDATEATAPEDTPAPESVRPSRLPVDSCDVV